MNSEEFAKLEVGERIEMLSGRVGEITECWISKGHPFAKAESNGRIITVWPSCVIRKVNQEEQV